MDFLEESDLIYTLPDTDTIIFGFRKLTETRHLLLKRGKIFKRKVFRYISFNNDCILYFKSETSALAQGCTSLHRSIVIPVQSPVQNLKFCVKVILQNHCKFFLFCEDQSALDLMVLYIKLASNNLLQSTLDKVCFNAIDQEFIALTNLKTPKLSNIQKLITPKNVVSRFLFSPTSDDILEFSEENIAQKLPKIEEYSNYDFQVDQFEDTILELPEIFESGRMMPPREDLPVQELINRPAEQIRNIGVSYLWNYQLDFAKDSFELIKKSDLRSWIYLAEVAFFKLLITGRKSDIKASMGVLHDCEMFFENEQDKYLEILQAELMLFKSVVLVLTGQKFKAFISLRTCWKTYKKYEFINIEDMDIKARVELGLGIFLLILSLAPASVSAILRLAGFSSDRSKGLEHLHRALEYKQSRSVYAGLILSLFYVELDPKPDKAAEIVQSLSLEYPGCVLIHWVQSITSWKRNQIDLAILYLNKALHFCGEDLSKQAAFIKYELGWLYFLRFEWTLAKNHFEGILLETLSLSSSLDLMVKKLILNGSLDQESLEKLDKLIKKPSKKEKKNWLDSESTPDRVYLPHKACLITQLVSCLSSGHSAVLSWLKVIQVSVLTSSRFSSFDSDFAKLSLSFELRGSIELLPYEVIYFMKQHTKILPHMLIKIIDKASDTVKKSNILPELCSGIMLQIMALALNGDTTIALALVSRCQSLAEQLPQWAGYLAPHSLYWCARVMIAEGLKSDAERLLRRAKKFKGYVFDIRCKIERVLNELI